MGSEKVLVVQKKSKISKGVSRVLDKIGWEYKAITPQEIMHSVKIEVPSCIILETEDKWSVDPKEIIISLKEFDDNLPIIVVSDDSEVEEVVEYMKEGVFDYFTSPLLPEKVENAIRRAARTYELTKKVFLLESQVGWRGKFDNIVGHSARMQEIFNLITSVAKSNATVLVMGGSGTGKELVAKAIHKYSDRAKHKFVDINCGAIPRELLENEMFGHERGAFTGADRRYVGSCEQADKGTLFLDEISEMDALLQVKLLRFLQERSFVRIGGTDRIQVDVRIIAATNRDLVADVESGKFREDLFYRLNVVPIVIPVLKERREDVPLLAKHFLEKYSAKNEKIFIDIAPDAMEALVNYDWQGNVRELENIIERMVVLNNDTQLKLKFLPPYIQESRKNKEGTPSVLLSNIDTQQIIPLELVEKYSIEAALRKCMGNVSEAAQKLKIGQATLYRKIKQYGLKI
ncbi:sigma-54 dependent transcriptional regulator [bacterium]|nr:sigma-54 dependent transcriptional regulator [bacterium]